MQQERGQSPYRPDEISALIRDPHMRNLLFEEVAGRLWRAHGVPEPDVQRKKRELLCEETDPKKVLKRVRLAYTIEPTPIDTEVNG